jgi:hypothetical protein
MRRINPRDMLVTAMASAVLLGIAACGGGGADDNVQASSNAIGSQDANSDKASEQSKARPSPRPNPPPVDPNPVVTPVDASLVLASTSASGRASDGSNCAISADGSRVAFTSRSGALVAGDSNNTEDVFVKNVRTGAIARVSTNSAGGQLQAISTCLGMTPDANYVVFMNPEVIGVGPYLPPVVTEAAIFVKNLRTGAVTNVAPPRNVFSNTAGYRFQSISDDGNRVALIALPTTVYLGGYETAALGPARALVRDIGTGALVDLSPQVSLDLSQGTVITNIVLSPDGSKLAFSSRANNPAVGDTNGGADVFTIDIASRAVSLVSPLGASPSFQNYAISGFLAGGSKLAFISSAPTSAGGVGAYVRDLDSGALSLVFAAPAGQALPQPLSFSADGSLLAYTRPYFVSGRNEAIVRNVSTGQEQLANVTSTGVVGNGESRFPLLSRDGSAMVYDSNATNLVRPVLSEAYLYRPYVKTINRPAGQTPG